MPLRKRLNSKVCVLALQSFAQVLVLTDWVVMNAPVIVVHDLGVDLAHPSLTGSLVPGRCFDHHPSNPWPDDGDRHHGTLAALAAVHVAPHVRILPVRCTNTNPARLAASLRFATASADIVLCAWSMPADDSTAMLRPAFAASRALVVAATGPGLGFPACLPTVLAVNDRPHPDARVVTLDPAGLPEFEVYAGGRGRRLARRRTFDGSSAASAMVAGLAARLIHRLSPTEIVARLAGRSLRYSDLPAPADVDIERASP